MCGRRPAAALGLARQAPVKPLSAGSGPAIKKAEARFAAKSRERLAREELQVARDIEVIPALAKKTEIKPVGGGEEEIDDPIRPHHAPQVGERGPRIEDMFERMVHRDHVERACPKRRFLHRTALNVDPFAPGFVCSARVKLDSERPAALGDKGAQVVARAASDIEDREGRTTADRSEE